MIKTNIANVENLANALGHNFILTGQNAQSEIQNIYSCERCKIRFEIFLDFQTEKFTSVMWDDTKPLNKRLGMRFCKPKE